MKQKDRTKHKKNLGRWKLIDDRSGFEIYSTEAVIDHNGYITSKNNYDPIHYTEIPIHYPIDKGPRIVRPEPEDNFIEITELTYTPYLWSEEPDLWASSEVVWGTTHLT